MKANHPKEELKAYADKELGFLAALKIQLHLKTCMECQETLSRLTSAAEMVRSLAGRPVPVPGGFAERMEAAVMPRLVNEKPSTPPRSLPVWQNRWVSLGAAGACAAAVLTAVVLNGGVINSVSGLWEPEDRLSAPPGGRMQSSRPLMMPGMRGGGAPGGMPGMPGPGGGTDARPRNTFVTVNPRGRVSTSPQAPMGHGDRVSESTEYAYNRMIAAAPEVEASRAVSSSPLGSSVITSEPSLLSAMRIVRKSEMTVRVKNLQERYDELLKMVKAYGGYVSDSNITTDGRGYRTGTIVMRVPPDCFEDMVQRIHKFGKVVSANVNSEDVTEESMRVEDELPRLRTREAELAAAFERLQKLNNYSAKFYAQERLADVRSRIRAYTFRQRFLKDQVHLATVRVTLTESPEKQSSLFRRDGWTLTGTTQQAFGKSLVLLQFLATILIWALVYFSIYVVLAIAAWQGLRKARDLFRPPSP